jgi:hypothetical protein
MTGAPKKATTGKTITPPVTTRVSPPCDASPSAPWYSCRRESRPERNRLGQIAFGQRQQIIGRTALSCLDLLIFDGLYLPQGRQSGFDSVGVWRR